MVNYTDILKSFESAPMSVNQIRQWLNDSAYLKESLTVSIDGIEMNRAIYVSDETYNHTRKFYHIYDCLKEFVEYEQYEDISAQAIKQLDIITYNGTDYTNTEALKTWLLKWQDVGRELWSGFSVRYCDNIDEKGNVFAQVIVDDTCINLSVEAFTNCLRLADAFSLLYFDYQLQQEN